MTVANTPGAIKKFKRTPWRFQVTFATPLKQLDAFVSAILGHDGEFESAIVTIDEIVFDAKNLNGLLSANSLSAELSHDYSISVDGKASVRELLKTALSDWIDFAFVPMPKPFVIFADHDEFATFYANTKSNLNQAKQSLLANGFREILDYQRQLS